MLYNKNVRLAYIFQKLSLLNLTFLMQKCYNNYGIYKKVSDKNDNNKPKYSK